MFTELSDNIRIMFIGPHRDRTAIIVSPYHEIYGCAMETITPKRAAASSERLSQ